MEQADNPDRKSFYKEKIPSMHRRCNSHDYRSVSSYMITLGKNPEFKEFFCRIFDAAQETPDFDCARARSDLLTPGIKRILLPRKAGIAGFPVPGSLSRVSEPSGSLRRESGERSLPAVELTDTGTLIRMAIRDFFKNHPALLLKKIVVMPDHIHMIIHVKEYLTDHLGHYIGLLKHTCTRYACDNHQDADRKVPFSIFQDNYHDRIIRNSDMLETERHYLDDNPRRYLMRKIYPEYFSSPVILTIGQDRYTAFGNILLLRDLHPEAVIVSSKYSASHLENLKISWRDAARERKALVSPFISKAEKTMREEILELGGRIVEILDNGFSEKYKPWGKNFDLCLEGRLLQIAPLEHNTAKKPLSRAKALELNALSRLLCRQYSPLTEMSVRKR